MKQKLYPVFILLISALAGISPLSAQKGPNWVSIGPISFPVNKSGQINGIGRISQIKFDPVNPARIYAVSPHSLWVSNDTANSWQVLPGADQQQLNTSYASICIDSTNNNILYAGTGDANYYGSWTGVLKSTDGGATFNFSNTGMGNKLVIEILMSPVDHNTLVAATNSGIYKSTNAGGSWTLIKSSATGVSDMCRNAAPGSATLYMVERGGGFYYSFDFGSTWTQAVTVNPAVSGNGARVTVTPADTSVVYAGFIGSGGGGFGSTVNGGGIIYRSGDGGKTFTMQKGDVRPNITGYDTTHSGQGNYNFDIVASPTDPNTLFLDAHMIWRSRDGGATWAQTYNTNWARTIHTDMHNMRFDPRNSGRLYNCNDGGVWLSQDTGTTWIPKCQGLITSEFYHMANSHAFKSLIGGGLQDNGEIYSNINSSSNTWYTNRGGDWTSAYFIDNDSLNTVYYASNGRRRNLLVAPNSGDQSLNLPQTSAGTDRFAFSYAHDNIGFYISDTVWLSNNIFTASPTWTMIYTSTLTPIASAISSTDPNILYILYRNASRVPFLYKSVNALSASPSFTAVTLPAGFASVLNAGSMALLKTGVVFLSANAQVYRSADQGVSWTNVSAGLPSLNIAKILTDTTQTNESLYAANGTVYYYNTTQNNWQLFATNLPVTARVSDLDIFYDNANLKNSVIRASTFGRGAWESPLYGNALSNTTYYSKPSGNLDQLSTWGLNVDGSGAAPANFTTDGQVFAIRNNTTHTIGANWTVSGINAKILTGDGINPINFTIPAGLKVNGVIDVTDKAGLILQNDGSFTPGTLSSGSTVNFSGNTAQAIPAGSYSNLINSDTSAIVNATAAINVSGTLTLNAKTNLDMGVNTLQGNIKAVNGTGVLYTADSSSAPFPSGLTWSGTIVMNGMVAQTIPADTINNLVINNAAGVTINGKLYVAGTVTPTAGTLNANNNLVLVANANATAIIAAGAGNYINGNVIAQYYIAPQRGSRLLGHPFTTPLDLQALANSAGFDISGTGFVNANPIDSYIYDGVTPFAASGTAWNPKTGLLLFTRGLKTEVTGSTYTAGPSPIILNGNGAVNSGTVVMPLNDASNSKKQYTAVINPYPCPISLNAATVVNNANTNLGTLAGNTSLVSPYVYFWNPVYSGGQTGDNRTARGGFDLITLNPASSIDFIVPSYGGFLVKAAQPGLKIQVAEQAKQPLLQAVPVSNIALDSTIELQLQSGGIFMDRVLLRYSAASTKAGNDWLDLVKLNNDLVNLYTLSSDLQNMEIDARPIATNDTIHLGLNTNLQQAFTLTTGKYTGPANVKVYLMDKFTQAINEIKSGFTYSFNVTADAASQGNNRFAIFSTPAVVTAIPVPATSAGILISPNPAHSFVTITMPPNLVSQSSVLSVINLAGQVVRKVEIKAGTTLTQLPLNNLPNGVYVVEILNKSTHYIDKIILE